MKVDAAECEQQLREKARIGSENPQFLLKTWDVAEWAVAEIDNLRAERDKYKALLREAKPVLHRHADIHLFNRVHDALSEAVRPC